MLPCLREVICAAYHALPQYSSANPARAREHPPLQLSRRPLCSLDPLGQLAEDGSSSRRCCAQQVREWSWSSLVDSSGSPGGLPEPPAPRSSRRCARPPASPFLLPFPKTNEPSNARGRRRVRERQPSIPTRPIVAPSWAYISHSLQARGRRFEPVWLHSPRDPSSRLAERGLRVTLHVRGVMLPRVKRESWTWSRLRDQIRLGHKEAMLFRQRILEYPTW